MSIPERGSWVSLGHAFPASLIGSGEARSRELAGEMTAELTANHSRRMTQLGLTG
jgi:hypothetical protein